MERIAAEEAYLKSQYKNQSDTLALSQALEMATDNVRQAEHDVDSLGLTLLQEMRRINVERMHDIQEQMRSWIHAFHA